MEVIVSLDPPPLRLLDVPRAWIVLHSDALKEGYHNHRQIHYLRKAAESSANPSILLDLILSTQMALLKQVPEKEDKQGAIPCLSSSFSRTLKAENFAGSTPCRPRICILALENPHCGSSGVPFMKRTTGLEATACCIADRVSLEISRACGLASSSLLLGTLFITGKDANPLVICLKHYQTRLNIAGGLLTGRANRLGVMIGTWINRCLQTDEIRQNEA